MGIFSHSNRARHDTLRADIRVLRDDITLIYSTQLNISRTLSTVVRALELLTAQQENTLMATLDDIRAAVAANSDVQTSAITLLEELHRKLEDALASGDTAALQQIVDDINAHKAALADAVVANTPAAPQP